VCAKVQGSSTQQAYLSSMNESLHEHSSNPQLVAKYILASVFQVC
jgi:hypothetical protein